MKGRAYANCGMQNVESVGRATTFSPPLDTTGAALPCGRFLDFAPYTDAAIARS